MGHSQSQYVVEFISCLEYLVFYLRLMAMNPHTPLPQETEATLVVCSEDPASVAEKIACLTSIGNYTLESRGVTEFNDTYFLGGTLLQGFAVRIRDAGHQVLVALKGPPTKTDWGAVQRPEIEAPWSQEAVRQIMEEIGGETAATPVNDCDFEQASPLEILERLGLYVVQARETRRQVRDVLVSVKGSVEVIAELVIDAVIYHFGVQDVRHYEVEVEEKRPGHVDEIREVLDYIIADFGTRLREWDQDKLSTGMAIEQLLLRGEMDGLFTDENALIPAAYDKLDLYFSTERL
jgi:hypothetical protein